MNQGKYVFSQVVEFIPRYQFDKLVMQYNGDWHVKSLNSYNHLLHLLFGQLTGCDSLRDICLCLEVHSKMLYHLGFRKTVTHTSLSRANENRDTETWYNTIPSYATLHIVYRLDIKPKKH